MWVSLFSIGATVLKTLRHSKKENRIQSLCEKKNVKWLQ